MQPANRDSTVFLKNHLIICGGGTSANHIVAELNQYKSLATDRQSQLGTGVIARDFLLIEPDEKHCKKLLKKYQYLQFINGDATDDDILEKANVRNAYGIFAILPNDKDNLFITFTAKQKNPKIRIVSRTTDIFNTGQKLFKAGASSVVSPNFIGGLRLVSEIARPNVTAFLDEMLRNKSSDLHIKEITIKPESKLAGKSLRDIDLTNKFKLIAVALERNGKDEEFDYNPTADTIIDAGDTIIVFGKGSNLQTLEKSL